MDLHTLGKQARQAGQELSLLSTAQKNKILLTMAQKIQQNKEKILQANHKDYTAAKKTLGKYMLDRLKLTEERIENMIDSLKAIAALPDAVGEIVAERTITQGLHLTEKRVGFGVICVIYEARPNVTSDVVGLCLKSCSAVILKAGKEAQHTVTLLVKLLSEVCPVSNAIQLVTEREMVKPLLSMNHYIDLIIPRGSEQLVQFIKQNSTIPVLGAGKGNCHIFVDETADQNQAMAIILNAKTQRPTVCNAAEKVLVHEVVAKAFLPPLAKALHKAGVEMRADEHSRKIISSAKIPCTKAMEEDWSTEYLNMIIGIRIVKNVDEAIAHINQYGSQHSEAILSENQQNIERFTSLVDAAVVYSNASTRFTDGFLFGLGAEIGNSTQKLHARGPLGLKALTTTKYIITGTGQVRK